MSATDTMRTIERVKAIGPSRLSLVWSDGSKAEVDLAGWLERPAFAALRDPAEFASVEIGDWGHSLVWPSGAEAGAEALWLETLTATRRDDTRAFLEWRLRHGLSLTRAAEALGLSRRMVAYYSNGEKPVPKTVLLACRGWEIGRTPTRPTLRQLFDASFDRFLDEHFENVRNNVSERNLCARLAPIMESMARESGFAEYYADPEYNRNEGRVKTIMDDKSAVVSVTCDLILHSRGHVPERDNLIAVEIKKANRPSHEKDQDRIRLRALTKTSYDGIWTADGHTLPEHVCGYEMGVFVELDMRKKVAHIEEYRKGERVSLTELPLPVA